MASAHVVEIFNVVGQRHAEFNYGGPGFTVEKFGLHSSPEGFDQGIVVATADRSEAEFKPAVTHVASKSPGCKLCKFNRSLQH